MNYDFDKVLSRYNTLSLKYDGKKLRGKPDDVIPLWVADTDFPTPIEVKNAILDRANHNIYGYSIAPPDYFNNLNNWLKKRFNYAFEQSWHTFTPGIVYALAISVKSFTQENDAVLIQQPVYPPFSDVVVENNRKLIVNNLIYNKDKNSYFIDFNDFEEKIKTNKVKLFLLCSPHNPVGRCWTKDELYKMYQICKKYNVVVVADEIHADFIYEPNKMVSFGTLDKDAFDNCVICYSVGKTFNLAGLQISDIIIKNPNLKQKFVSECNKNGYSIPNIFGLVGANACYQHGENWLNQELDYLNANKELLINFIKENLKDKVTMCNIESTYLAWLDFSNINLTLEDLNKLLIEKAKVWLNPGTMFSPKYTTHQRLNFATQQSVLIEALEKIKTAINSL